MLDTERILIVDDDQTASREAAGFLERQGYPVRVARTGREGLRMIRETPVSLVLLGLTSGDMDHARILQEAGQAERPCEVLILAEPGTLDRAIRAGDGGAAGCIVKPVDLARLGIIARRVLERRALLRDNARLSADLAARLRESERERRRLDVLYALSRKLAAVHDTDALLSFLVEETRGLLGAEAAGIRLLEGEDLVVAARTESAAPLMASPRIKVGESLSGRVVATGQPVVSEDLHEDVRFNPASKRAALEEGFHGFLGVPLRIHDQAIGALNIYTKGSRRFTSDEISLLSALADQASLAIHRTRLLREAEAGRHLVERLYRVAVSMQASWDRAERLAAFTRGVHEAVGFDRISVLLATSDGRSLELVSSFGEDEPAPPPMLPLSPAAGVFYQAYETKRTIAVLGDADLETVLPLAPAYRSDPYFRTRRFIAAPLLVGDRAIGVVVADNKRSRKPILPARIEPFVLLCQQLATALEAARLYAESRARGREAIRLSTGLALLNRASRALHRTLDVEPVLDAALRELGRAFGAAGVLLSLAPDAGRPARSIGHWLSEAHGRDVTLRPTASVSRLVRDTGKPLVLSDIAERSDIVHPAHFRHGVKSLAAFPILGQRQRVLGVLFLYYTTTQVFPEREVQLLTAYADQLATALENARLYAETRTQETRLTQIFDSTSDGIMLVAGARRIEAANQRVADLLGFDREAGLGREVSELLAGCRASAADAARIVEALGSLSAAPDEADGDLELGPLERILHWVARPTKNASGVTVGFTLSFRDVTQEREISRMKSEFVSFVTHQLRTPLTGIRWMLELAAAQPDLPAEPASYVQDARDSAARLIGLVNDLLDVSRLERGKLVAVPQEVRLEALTRHVLDEMSVLLQEKDHRLSVDVDGDEKLPPIMADPQLLRQAILNLVSNAVKYTPPRGEIAIRMGREGSAVRWSIHDTGIGVPDHSQGRLFEKFYRAENALAIETEGTGLGLYLVRLIMEQLGGRVWCESAEGCGATFTLTMPLGSEIDGTH